MLIDNILNNVTKPARYTGGEWNSIAKDWDKTNIKIALSFPDLYEIGMSNMALPILYGILNSQPDVLAERVFAPWADMESAMRAGGFPLFSLESKHPLKDFDIIGFSLGYELTYTNVLNMLDLAQIPVLASERNDSHPLIIAGGTCSLNPEPMADFIDIFFIGDGEETILEFIDSFRNWRKLGEKATKKQLLHQVATIPGIYVPSLYHVEYKSDGTLKSFVPTVAEAKSSIQRRMVTELPPPVTRPVVPYIEVVHDRAGIEIQRGCSRGCRFCQAGIIFRPVRERPHEEVLQAAGELIANCGYDKVSLVSLNTSDYTGIDEPVADTHDDLYFFTNRGKVFSLKCHEIPGDGSRTTKGTAVVNLFSVIERERVTAVVAVTDFMPDAYMVLATSGGEIKKTAVGSFASVRSSGHITMDLEPGDELVSACVATDQDDVVLVTQKGQSIRFAVSSLRASSRTSGGVRAIRLAHGDRVVSMDRVDKDGFLLVVTEGGFGKLTSISQYPKQKRAGSGVRTFKFAEKTGEVTAARMVYLSEQVMIISAEGIVTRTPVKEKDPRQGITTQGRSTQGVRMMRLDARDKVVAITSFIVDKDKGAHKTDTEPDNTDAAGKGKRQAKGKKGGK